MSLNRKPHRNSYYTWRKNEKHKQEQAADTWHLIHSQIPKKLFVHKYNQAAFNISENEDNT